MQFRKTRTELLEGSSFSHGYSLVSLSLFRTRSLNTRHSAQKVPKGLRVQCGGFQITSHRMKTTRTHFCPPKKDTYLYRACLPVCRHLTFNYLDDMRRLLSHFCAHVVKRDSVVAPVYDASSLSSLSLSKFFAFSPSSFKKENRKRSQKKKVSEWY